MTLSLKCSLPSLPEILRRLIALFLSLIVVADQRGEEDAPPHHCRDDRREREALLLPPFTLPEIAVASVRGMTTQTHHPMNKPAKSKWR
jgi:hypothetical protein